MFLFCLFLFYPLYVNYVVSFLCEKCYIYTVCTVYYVYLLTCYAVKLSMKTALTCYAVKTAPTCYAVKTTLTLFCVLYYTVYVLFWLVVLYSACMSFPFAKPVSPRGVICVYMACVYMASQPGPEDPCIHSWRTNKLPPTPYHHQHPTNRQLTLLLPS